MNGPLIAAQQGEASAFEELIALHRTGVYRITELMLGDGVRAEEPARVSAETFRQARRALSRFRDEVPSRAWLYGIAVSEATEAGLEPRRGVALPPEDTTRDVSSLEAARFDEDELSAHLRRCLALLPADRRAAVILRDVEGLTGEEAAEALDLELDSFRRLLHEGRMELRRRLERLAAAS